MSQEYRERVRRTPSVYETMTDEEKHNPLDWCGISDDIISEQYPGEDIDGIIKNLSEADFRALHALVLKRLRKRKKEAQEAAVDDEEEDEESVEEREIEEETA